MLPAAAAVSGTVSRQFSLVRQGGEGGGGRGIRNRKGGRGAGCRFEVRRVMCTSAYASELTSQITGQL